MGLVCQAQGESQQALVKRGVTAGGLDFNLAVAPPSSPLSLKSSDQDSHAALPDDGDYSHERQANAQELISSPGSFRMYVAFGG